MKEKFCKAKIVKKNFRFGIIYISYLTYKDTKLQKIFTISLLKKKCDSVLFPFVLGVTKNYQHIYIYQYEERERKKNGLKNKVVWEKQEAQKESSLTSLQICTRVSTASRLVTCCTNSLTVPLDPRLRSCTHTGCNMCIQNV